LGWTEYISKTQFYFGFGLDGIHFENAALFRFSLFRFWVGRNTFRKRSFISVFIISVLGWTEYTSKTQLYFGFGLGGKHFENAALFRLWVGQKTFRKRSFISVLGWTENISKTQLYFGFALDGKHFENATLFRFWVGRKTLTRSQLFFGFGLDGKHFKNSTLFRFWVGRKTF